MRATEATKRSNPAGGTMSAGSVTGPGGVEEFVDVIDASGVSWLATIDGWRRDALERCDLAGSFD